MVWESRHTWEFSIITACVSLSCPDFVVVTRDEFVGLGGRGWKVAGLWVTKPQDISIFRNFGEGGWCSYENVAVFVFR